MSFGAFSTIFSDSVALKFPICSTLHLSSVDKTTNRPIPVSLQLPDGSRQVLVAYGAKRVTFLQIAVYAFSAYASEDAVRGWNELGSGQVEDEVVKGLLRGEVAVRIGETTKGASIGRLAIYTCFIYRTGS